MAIWHPYSQMRTASFPLIKRAKGIYLYTEKKRYLDGISSWWVNLHGHTHPYISSKIKAQLDQLEHVIFADFTHQPAEDLAERLLEIVPGNMSKVFFSDNGSNAVEVALKIALQHNKNKKIVCFKGSFHGETFGAMSASGKNRFNKPFWSYLFEVESIDPPLRGFEERSILQLENLIKKGGVACFIFEPLILGVGGMITYSADGLNALIHLCQENGIITIADEVMTGFGRTGPLFACSALSKKPDIYCLSKGITGGFLPLGATLCTDKMAEPFLGGTLQNALLHGHSYTGNPLGCVSALASLDLLLDPACTLQREMISLNHSIFCKSWSSHPKLTRCESVGTILILEYKAEEASYFQPIRDRLYRYFMDRNILLRPLGNVLYVMPPYCILKEELETIYSAIKLTLEGDL